MSRYNLPLRTLLGVMLITCSGRPAPIYNPRSSGDEANAIPSATDGEAKDIAKDGEDSAHAADAVAQTDSSTADGVGKSGSTAAGDSTSKAASQNLATDSNSESETITPASDLEKIHKRNVVSLTPTVVNVVSIKATADAMLSDGSWAAINYKQKNVVSGWSPASHYSNLLAMAGAYRQEGTELFGAEDLKNKIIQGLAYWVKNNFKAGTWYYDEIAAPRAIANTLVLMKGAIPAEKLKSFSSILQNLMEQKGFQHDADNLLAVCIITMLKADVEDNHDLMKAAFEKVAGELNIFPSMRHVGTGQLGDAGIKTDFSFHQHRQQLYMGGYGLSYVRGNLMILELAEGTSFAAAFNADKKRLLSQLLLQGAQSLSYRGSIDFGALGRTISRKNGMKGLTIADIEKAKKFVAGEQAQAYDSWINHIAGEASGAQGNRYFWNSAIMTQHGANSYLSAKVISKRSVGTEFLNGENQKYYHLPFGATNIMTRGDEYLNIAPIWDWSRIPGTTAEMNPDLPSFDDSANAYADGTFDGYIAGKNDFAGGVSDGKAGMIAFEQNYLGIQAQKSYFFLDGLMVCMGTGIKGTKSRIIATNLNQAYRSGPITASFASGVKTYETGPISQYLKDASWVHHNGVGYILRNEGAMLETKIQTGSWNAVNKTIKDDGSVNGEVFSLWLSHGNSPTDGSYFYIVAPDKTAAQAAALAQDPGLTVSRSDSRVQAMLSRTSEYYAVVFHQAGTVDMGDGLSITSDKKALVLVKKQAFDNYQVTVSDPMADETTIVIKLLKTAEGTSVLPKAKSASFTFILPQGESLGSAVSALLMTK